MLYDLTHLDSVISSNEIRNNKQTKKKKRKRELHHFYIFMFMFFFISKQVI
jgi:hypothetical protein